MSDLPRQKPGALTALPWASWLLLIGAGVLALHPLSLTWGGNPNYSFGWLIPVIAAYLFAERWPARPDRVPGSPLRLVVAVIVWGLIFFFFRMAAETDPDWRPGLWMLVGLYVATLVGWLWLYGGIPWIRHFAFPVGFLFLSLPWLFQIEYPLTQGLMRWNAVAVSWTLKMLAISATPEGNIIQLQNCQLGVEEACSGILSLQASLMMGCLLGEIYQLGTSRRVMLIFSSMLLALAGNYFRTFFLAMVAFYSGTDAVLRWHDTAGYSILVFTGVGSWLCALALGGGKLPGASVPKSSTARAENSGQSPNAFRLAVAAFVTVLVAEALTQAWFGWRELSLSRHPDWIAQMPAVDTFKPAILPDITMQTLRSDEFKGGRWSDDNGYNWNVYWLRYDPKPYTRIVLGWHNPDNCLPDAGLIKDRDYPNFTVSTNGIDFYVHPKKFMSRDIPVYIFWVVYPNRGDLPPDEDTRIELPFATKLRSHFLDTWNGNRGVGVETMEVALVGPKSYEEAEAAYRSALKTMIIPGKTLAAGTSH